MAETIRMMKEMMRITLRMEEVMTMCSHLNLRKDWPSYRCSKMSTSPLLLPSIMVSLLIVKSYSLDAVQMKIRFVSCGYFHALAVTEEGATFGWGRNDFG